MGTPTWPPFHCLRRQYGHHRVMSKSSMGAFHLVKIFGNFRSVENGKRFFGSPYWKIPPKSEKSKEVGPFSRLELSEQNLEFYSHISRTLYQFQMLLTRQPYWCPVGKRARPHSGVYDQMEQFLTYRKIHFCSYRNFRIFYLNGKRPIASKYIYATVMVEGIPALTSYGFCI